MKFRIKRGYNAPVPGNIQPMPYEVHCKKLFRPWEHVKTFNTEDEANEYIQRAMGQDPEVE